MFKRKDKNQPSRNPIERTPSAPVFSYYANRTRADDAPERKTASRPVPASGLVKYAPSIIAAIILIGALGYAAHLGTRPRLIILSDAAAQPLNAAEYEQSVQNILQSSVLNRTKMTFQTAKVTEEIQRQYPELGEVVVTVPVLGQKPVVKVQPSPARLVLANQQTALVVDSTGRAVADARDLKTESIVVTDESGLTLERGKAVIPKDYVDFILAVKYQLDAKQVEIDSLTLPAIANELHLRVKGQQYYIKYNLRLDARQQTGAFLALKEELESKKTTPKEYIDLRVEERVFYK